MLLFGKQKAIPLTVLGIQLFWEGHDPTQGMRQGNHRGTQYRSGIYPYGCCGAGGTGVSCPVGIGVGTA